MGSTFIYGVNFLWGYKDDLSNSIGAIFEKTWIRGTVAVFHLTLVVLTIHPDHERFGLDSTNSAIFGLKVLDSQAKIGHVAPEDESNVRADLHLI